MKYYLLHIEELDSCNEPVSDKKPETLIVNQYQLNELKRMAKESDEKIVRE